MQGRPARLFASPLEGPDYPWAALVDLLAASAAATEDFEDYAKQLSADQPGHAVYALAPAGRELLVSTFVVDGILDHQGAQGSEQARRAWVEFNDVMAEVFATQHAHLPQPGFDGSA